MSTPIPPARPQGPARETSSQDKPAKPRSIEVRTRAARDEAEASLPDLNTVEGQDAFFNMVGVEGIEQCFRDDLKTVEAVYRQKVAEHAAPERGAPDHDARQRRSPAPQPRARIDPSYFAEAKTARVPGNGDCSLEAFKYAADQLPIVPGQAVPSVPATADEMREQMVAHVAREYITWRGTPAHALPDEKQYLAVLPSDDRERGRLLQQLATRRSWNHDLGDLFVAIAADTYGMAVEVLTRYTDREHQVVFGRPRHPGWQLRLRLDGAHYEPVVE